MTSATAAPTLDLRAQPIGPPPIWPAVIGALSIATGAWGIVESAPGALMSAWPRAMEVWTGNFRLRSALDLRAVVSAAFTGSYLLAILAGILLVRRRRGAVVLHWAFAVLAIVGAVLQARSYAGSFYILRWPSRLRYAMYLYPMAAHLLIGLAYPFFAFIWFCRPSVRRCAGAWRTHAGRAASAPVGVVWPAVLGIAAMVLGGAFLLHAVVSLLQFTMLTFAGQVSVPRLGWFAILPTDVLVRAVPVVAGWLLLRRRRAGVACALVYAVCACFHIAATVAFLFVLASRISAPYPGGMTMWVLRQALRPLSLLAPPIFLIGWFARPKVRAEVRSWRRAETAGHGE